MLMTNAQLATESNKRWLCSHARFEDPQLKTTPLLNYNFFPPFKINVIKCQKFSTVSDKRGRGHFILAQAMLCGPHQFLSLFF